ncbi:MAG: NAD synthetase [Anaerolineae bacterium SM23_ 63]|nr:MAG: NAD synthetase [Anaerolineae bacterium SM23_ 63]HEY47791.1 NAD+ synthase [Anaerolineae bacterium]
MAKQSLSLEIDPEKTRNKITEFIRTEIHSAGFQRAVVGVSGGVDSALTCYLTAEALGSQNVLALRMPYKTSTSESMEHAGLVIEATGVLENTVPITDMVNPLFAQFPEADRVRRGNAMARARMIVLYDQSAAFKGLVVGTGNKTEILLGYTTLYGDSACAFVPLGDLYKTQVRQLARAIGVPGAIIAKPPSADLWIGQTDEGELGFTYEDVDRLFLYFVDKGYSPQACVDVGFDPGFVAAVIEQMRQNEFKRALPPIAKLGDSKLAYEFQLPMELGK